MCVGLASHRSLREGACQSHVTAITDCQLGVNECVRGGFYVPFTFHALVCSSFLRASIRTEPSYCGEIAPLLFEPNRGQVSSEARFLANGTDYRILLTDQELVLLMQHGLGHTALPRKPGVLRLRWLGAQTASRFIGEQEQTSYSNYFTGSDQTRWQTRVPHFASVKQANVLPGIDLRFYGTSKGELEYDLLLGPEVDASQASFEVIGADSVRVDKDGGLLLKVNGVETRQLPPRAYEVEGGCRRALTSSYVMRSKKYCWLRSPGPQPGDSSDHRSRVSVCDLSWRRCHEWYQHDCKLQWD